MSQPTLYGFGFQAADTAVKVIIPERNEIRRFTLNENVTYSGLYDKLKLAFKLDNTIDFDILYRDSDGDWVTMTSDSDIKDAIRRSGFGCHPKLEVRQRPIQREAQQEHEQRPQQQQQAEEASPSTFDRMDQVPQRVLSELNSQLNGLKIAAQQGADNLETSMQYAAKAAAQIYQAAIVPFVQHTSPPVCNNCTKSFDANTSRFHCIHCTSFNLCHSCAQNISHNHSLMEVPGVNCKRAQEASSARYLCNFCESWIDGARHSCSVCQDFDLCQGCFGIVKENHAPHVFVTHVPRPRTQQEAANRSSSVLHRGIVCDRCDGEVRGIRYKCGHCPDYDLCETCEPFASTCHNNAHVFLKIKSPVAASSSFALLPRFQALAPQQEPTRSKSSTGFFFSSGQPKQPARPTPNVTLFGGASETAATSSNTTPTTTETATTSVAKPEEQNEEKTPPMGPNQQPTVSSLSAAFIEDVNYPDGTIVRGGSTVLKIWKMRNDGRAAWPEGSVLVCTGGDYIQQPGGNVHVIAAKPGESATVLATLKMPRNPGKYKTYFRLRAPHGAMFGPVLWSELEVHHVSTTPASRRGSVASFGGASVTTTTTTAPGLGSTATFGGINLNSDELSSKTASSLTLSSSMIYPTLRTSTSANEEVQSIAGTVTTASDFTETGSHRGIDDDYDPFSDPVMVSPSDSRRSASVASVVSYPPTESRPLSSSDSIRFNSPSHSQSGSSSFESSSSNYVFVDTTETSTPALLSNPHEKTPPNLRSNTENNNQQQQQQQQQRQQNDTPPPPRSAQQGPYQAQLTQIHEMGLTFCDELALRLLHVHDGNVDRAIPEILERLYPE